MQTPTEVDEWIQQEQLDIGPGGEAVDLRELVGESRKGQDKWLSVGSLEGG